LQKDSVGTLKKNNNVFPNYFFKYHEKSYLRISLYNPDVSLSDVNARKLQE